MPEPVNDGLLHTGQILCVDFNCLQASQCPTASVMVARCPTRARAETTLIGAMPIFRARHIAHRATPRMASDTASASVLMTDTVPTVAAGRTVDLGLSRLPEPMKLSRVTWALDCLIPDFPLSRQSGYPR